MTIGEIEKAEAIASESIASIEVALAGGGNTP